MKQRDEEFCQIPVDVLNQNDLNRALDGLNEPNNERWFSQLPPILLFQMKRYTFDVKTKTAQKLNNRIEFPEAIFMDRYLLEKRDLATKAFKKRCELEESLIKADDEMKSINEKDSTNVLKSVQCVKSLLESNMISSLL